MNSTEHRTCIRIITLNCWGLKYISKNRSQRLTEIGIQLGAANPRPDIVGLQECWTQQDYSSIRRSTGHILPFGKFYHSGIFGGGLAILSRWPIEESSMLRYPLNGRPTAFFRGDWFVGKGVACARIKFGPAASDVAEVFCTHLHAPYEKEPNDSYICHRTAQAWEIAKLMRGATERGHLVIGLGDFNMVPLSLAHQLIETHAPVRDVWRIIHPHSSVGAANDSAEKAKRQLSPTVDVNLAENGTTCDSALNTWRWSKSQQKALAIGKPHVVKGTADDPGAKRLDYIFLGNGAGPTTTRHWVVASVNVGMTARHPTLGCSLSDHFSVEATITRDPHQETSDITCPERSTSSTTDDFAVAKPLNPSTPTPPRYLPLSTYSEILTMIHTYTSRELLQRRLRLAHFCLSLLLSLSCLLGVWSSTHSSTAFILALVSTLSLATGVIDGLIGGLFVSSELRALREFEWEITNVRERAAQSQEDTVVSLG